MEEKFKDLFSQHSEIYKTFRPKYPRELYIFLNGLVQEHNLAWDCATGNGQAAVALSEFFNKVIATDASEAQLQHAEQKSNIEYKVALAENSGLESVSVDLITVATAAHWFNLVEFYKETDRVLKPGGILAIWSYWQPNVTQEIDEILNNYCYNFLNGYWAPQITYALNGYNNFPFPYELLDTPTFFCEENWNLSQLVGFLRSWSGTQTYINKNNYDPTSKIADQLKAKWGSNEIRKITWKLNLKVGKKPSLG